MYVLDIANFQYNSKNCNMIDGNSALMNRALPSIPIHTHTPTHTHEYILQFYIHFCYFFFFPVELSLLNKRRYVYSSCRCQLYISKTKLLLYTSAQTAGTILNMQIYLSVIYGILILGLHLNGGKRRHSSPPPPPPPN